MSLSVEWNSKRSEENRSSGINRQRFFPNFLIELWRSFSWDCSLLYAPCEFTREDFYGCTRCNQSTGAFNLTYLERYTRRLLIPTRIRSILIWNLRKFQPWLLLNRYNCLHNRSFTRSYIYIFSSFAFLSIHDTGVNKIRVEERFKFPSSCREFNGNFVEREWKKRLSAEKQKIDEYLIRDGITLNM